MDRYDSSDETLAHGDLEEDSGRGILAYSAARQLREQAKRDWVRGAM